ncbi:transporter substrate-binding domain-containing protein [Roseomonas arctica]|uniref:Transporter substrate-binding domain-containing protein n=2 Tax=Plastoroseomonas arctica TaxID=1509237 RepID=A0AAF1KN16_9PROT|nr:transporter substrate-binding domain-containing protein [Plastoroseomonas arctica]
MIRRNLLAFAGLLAAVPAFAQAPLSAAARAELAPTGTLRAAINFGNTVLVQRGPTENDPRGVSPALARALAARLGVPLTIVPFDAAGRVTEANRASGGTAWDIAFLAVDPVRGEGMAFTAPYVVIEGIYAVPATSAIRSNEDVDRAGVRIAVGRGSAYDLFLTRAIRNATLVRTDTSERAITEFAAGGMDVIAGVGQPIREFAATRPDMRVLPGRFMVIEQAMAVPRGRDAALAALRDFVEEAKASGFVARALAESNQPDAAVAPLAR